MVLHIDQTLSVWVDQYGAWVYPVLFLIVFAETGLPLAWVGGLVAADCFGNIPFIKDHLNTIVLLGLAAAIVPVVGAGLFKLIRSRRQ